MKNKVFAYMEKWDMLRDGDTVLCGFSGGADSTALLLLLQEYGEARDVCVHAVHVNHGIRGAEADRDETFCREFCQARRIPFTAVRVDVPGEARRNGVGVEEAGRNARRRVLGAMAEELSASRIALAHHQSDQAETMLFRLMRGAGLRGLRGMAPVSGRCIRPLLCADRPEIEAWLSAQGAAWVEDSTNRETRYTRNWIRSRILLPMEEFRPGSASRMAGAAERLLELEDYMEQETRRARESCARPAKDGIAVRLDRFCGLHPALQKNLIQSCLSGLPGGLRDVEAVHVERICALPRGKRGSRIRLPGGNEAVLGYGELLLRPEREEKKEAGQAAPELPGECAFLGERFFFSVEEREKNEEIPVNRYTKWFDYDKIIQGIVLRTRRPGDYLSNARGAHKKLKDYLIDCKVPREERDRLILLADGSHVIWVVGMRISEEYKVTERTRRVLKVQKRGSTEE
ncbi:MAG: tRNA lysidine(34) synthetase TilS [Eubacteriales bacterium]|nr:tRNA lysidine(34) synthetase TilS [Eubacteriales bacterium]